MSMLSKVISKFNVIHIKTPMTFLTEIGKAIQKVLWNHKSPWIGKAILRKKLETSYLLISNYTTKNNKTVLSWHKSRPMEKNWEPTYKPNTHNPQYLASEPEYSKGKEQSL